MHFKRSDWLNRRITQFIAELAEFSIGEKQGDKSSRLPAAMVTQRKLYSDDDLTKAVEMYVDGAKMKEVVRVVLATLAKFTLNNVKYFNVIASPSKADNSR